MGKNHASQYANFGSLHVLILQVSFIGFGTSASLQPVKQNKANIKRKYKLFFIFYSFK